MRERRSRQLDVDGAKEKSIVEVLAVLGVQLRQSGRLLVGLCPLHDDRDTESFVVYIESNTWACFGAGCKGKAGINGGDTIELVRQYLDCSFKEAVEWLLDLNATRVEVKRRERPEYVERTLPLKFVSYWHGLLGDRRKWFLDERMFTDETIDRYMLGWDGTRYTIPVWAGEPGASACLNVRRRASELTPDDRPKYIGVEDYNNATLCGRSHVTGETVLVLGGELDCYLAAQDGLPALSPVNGVWGWMQFPDEWVMMWLNGVKRAIIVFDRGEETVAGQLAVNMRSQGVEAWVLSFPPIDTKAKDYTDYRQIFSAKEICAMWREQLDDFEQGEVIDSL
jgi:hypothetical protein